VSSDQPVEALTFAEFQAAGEALLPARDLWRGQPPSPMGTRTANAVTRHARRHGIAGMTAGDLAGLTRQELLDGRNFGPGMLAEVERVLALRGLALSAGEAAG
jgi:hypothetical protein